MGEDYTQQVAGENPPTPGSGPSSPSSVEPGASESAQSAASLSPPSVARTNTTAGSGAGETAGPERNIWPAKAPSRRGMRALLPRPRCFSPGYLITERGYWVKP